ncbi:MAG: endonuclease/exonuclease/phosphatase family protein [Desulfobacterales bacterium]|nr:endonuclease/exonuclease/phosphatase family protein [Desulfobacterales bacterium]MDD4071619.1 endonuclease/exonuclease/phosphatase family protein [Desulfobacterales bacterium]MDD4391619.1 endonuclease/exonuclease/phosphatase family protein [Desulfobacterales bacterium]
MTFLTCGNTCKDFISVLTLNLRFGLADDGSNSWTWRKRIFPILLKRYPADFIGFQEANDFQTDFLNDILDEYHFIGQRVPAPSFWQNNIIFYRNPWKCIHYDHFYLSATPTVPSRSPESLWARQCTIGVFQYDDRRLLCINTHLDFSSSVQTHSAQMIMNRLSQLPSELPAILFGDFNASPFCPCYRVFTDKRNPPFLDHRYLFKNVFSSPFPGTHHGFKGDVNGNHIDWILYRGCLRPIEYGVIHDAIDGRYPSDHFPLFAGFSWRSP